MRSIEKINRLVAQGYLVNKWGVLVHREVYEKAKGKLPKGWVVMHYDANKENNALDNLIAMPQRFHNKLCRTEAEKQCKFTKLQIEQMVKAYVNLDLNKGLFIEIKVVISPEQLSTPVSASIKRSGSSLYR